MAVQTFVFFFHYFVSNKKFAKLDNSLYLYANDVLFNIKF